MAKIRAATADRVPELLDKLLIQATQLVVATGTLAKISEVDKSATRVADPEKRHTNT